MGGQTQFVGSLGYGKTMEWGEWLVDRFLRCFTGVWAPDLLETALFSLQLVIV